MSYLLATLLAAAPPSAAIGQEPAAIAQVDAPADDRAILSPPRTTRDVRPGQVGAAPGSPSQIMPQIMPQITGERGAEAPGTQLSEGRSAEAPASLSQPAEGRNVATTRIVGQDRCDPSADNAGVAICRRPIETRSRDYARPDPLVLSPEQRLLVDQRLRAGQPSGGPFAPRPDDRADPDTAQGQLVGALMGQDDRRGVAVAPERPEASLPPEALVVIDSILRATANQTPSAPR